MGHGHTQQAESPYPHAMPQTVPNAPVSFDPQYTERLVNQIKKSMESLSTYFVDQSNRVDSYRPQSLTGESLTTEPLQPAYECDEIITSVIVTGPTSTGPGEVNTISANGAITAPIAGASISGPITLAAGVVYSVTATVYVDGTVVTTTDDDNMKFGGTSGPANHLAYAAGLPPQSYTWQVTGNGGIISIINNNAGSAAAVYHAMITATPVVSELGTSFSLQLGRRAWNLLLPPTGILVIAPIQIALGRSDTRQLSASVAGDWSFELMGYADTGRRGRV